MGDDPDMKMTNTAKGFGDWIWGLWISGVSGAKWVVELLD